MRENFPRASIQWDEKKEKRKEIKKRETKRRKNPKQKVGRNRIEKGKIRKNKGDKGKKRQKRERGVKSFTFSLRFMEIGPSVFVGARGKVHQCDESFR